MDVYIGDVVRVRSVEKPVVVFHVPSVTEFYAVADIDGSHTVSAFNVSDVEDVNGNITNVELLQLMHMMFQCAPRVDARTVDAQAVEPTTC